MDLLYKVFDLNDVQFFFYCAAAAMIGGWLKSITNSYDFDKSHLFQDKFKAKDWGAAGANVIARMIVSFASGGVFALIMLDSVVMQKGAVAKLLFLSVVVGYIAPELWKSQERRIIDKINKGLDDAVERIANKS